MQERLGLEILPETRASCSLLSGLLTMVESGFKKKVGPQCLLHASCMQELWPCTRCQWQLLARKAQESQQMLHQVAPGCLEGFARPLTFL